MRLKVLERDPQVSIEIEWDKPTQTYGELKAYRVRWGIKDHHKLHEEMLGPNSNSKKIRDLERGIEYEFRIAGANHIGIGQEAIYTYNTPEGLPTGNKFSTFECKCIKFYEFFVFLISNF
jgi:receptor-type tyrosine-protein phosphatase F